MFVNSSITWVNRHFRRAPSLSLLVCGASPRPSEHEQCLFDSFGLWKFSSERHPGFCLDFCASNSAWSVNRSYCLCTTIVFNILRLAAAQQTFASDPKYKKYTQQVEKCLNSFENIHEWADCIAFLKQLLKVLLHRPCH